LCSGADRAASEASDAAGAPDDQRSGGNTRAEITANPNMMAATMIVDRVQGVFGIVEGSRLVVDDHSKSP
jgi:hypothetical protein